MILQESPVSSSDDFAAIYFHMQFKNVLFSSSDANSSESPSELSFSSNILISGKKLFAQNLSTWLCFC